MKHCSERQKISACVLSYNREQMIATCLKAVQFADEVILVDKRSSDNTRAVATPFVDELIEVPWTPVVEETREFAVARCRHEWVICLDDDEMLSPEAALFIDEELKAPRADVYYIPQRHYILGTFDPEAYYWPEHQPKVFRRGSVEFTPTVHGGMKIRGRAYKLPADSEMAIHHLSHADVRQWLEKTNRYTSQPDRVRMSGGEVGALAFAHRALDKWSKKCGKNQPGTYVEAVSVLRAVYDIIDQLKEFEGRRGISGLEQFRSICDRLETEYSNLLQPISRPRNGPQRSLRGSDARPISHADEVRRKAELDVTSDLARVSAEAEGMRRIRGEGLRAAAAARVKSVVATIMRRGVFWLRNL